MTDALVTLDNDHALLCPGCGGNCLHHGTIAVFSRSHEDAKTIVSVIGATSFAERENPSHRRDSLAIEFWCENCDSKFELNITQHKGSTFIMW